MKTKRYILTLLNDTGDVIDARIFYALSRDEALKQAKLFLNFQGLKQKFKLNLLK
jgi:hypothetical protein